MFDGIIRNTALFRDLQETKYDLQHKYDTLVEDHERMKKELTEKLSNLEKDLEEIKSAGPKLTEDGKSYITFEFDNELNVVTKSQINKDVVNTLIDSGYILSEHSEDVAMIQLAFILIANEVTEQIIEEVNDHDPKLNS